MRTIGCLAVIVLVGIGIFLLTSSQDADDEQKAQWVGEKAHRGWNRMKKAALVDEARLQGIEMTGWETRADLIDALDRSRGRPRCAPPPPHPVPYRSCRSAQSFFSYDRQHFF